VVRSGDLDHYQVWDHRGSLFIVTTNRVIAEEYLQIARAGYSARVWYWLERWHWRVPRYLLVDRSDQ
jgi:hypothetical protein